MDGWHIPSDEEWKTLEMYLGMTEEEANMENIPVYQYFNGTQLAAAFGLVLNFAGDLRL
jgi:uncharacterized protein (TIGR02145 family)